MQAAYTYRENVLTSQKSEKNARRGYRFLFGGQEVDNEVYGDYNSYTAEYWQYDPHLGRRWNVDPMERTAAGWSPYRAFFCNPIYYIDPSGMVEDDYGLDKDENITLLRETDDKTDKLIALDDAGKETDKFIEVEKGILNNVKSDKSYRGVAYDYMEIQNDDQASKIFEFLSQNSDVECSQLKYGSDLNYVSTSHNIISEHGGADLMYRLLENKTYNIREHTHSHPNSTTGPSGFHILDTVYGDKQFAEWVNKYAPAVILNIYEVLTNKYIEYNHKGVVKK